MAKISAIQKAIDRLSTEIEALEAARDRLIQQRDPKVPPPHSRSPLRDEGSKP